MTNDYAYEFRQAMATHGLHPEHIVADGKIQRFPVGGVGKQNRNGWYVFFVDSNGAGGAFGNWAEGLSEKWVSGNIADEPDPERRRAFNEAIATARKEAEQQRIQDAESAAQSAVELWGSAYALNGASSPYLERKQIKGVALRLERDTPNLLVPMYAPGMRMVGVQRIMPDGGKRFLSGASIKGACCVIKGNANERVYVCEGYATAESVWMATGCMTFVAFNAGNLFPVCDQIRKKSDALIVVCGDNDLWSTKADGTPYNAGVDKAQACADNVPDCVYVLPAFASLDGKPTDFNDLHCREGIDVVRAQVFDPFEQKKIELKNRIREWVLKSSGKFTVTEIDRELSLSSPEQRAIRTETLKEMLDAGCVEQDEGKRSVYRTRDFALCPIDLYAEVREPDYELWLPCGLGEHVSLSPNNVVCVAGETNAGKTTWALETLRENLAAYAGNAGKRFFYLSSEMSPEELQGTIERLGGKHRFDRCTFINRQFEPYDLIYGNPEMQHGFVFIDFLETRGGEYSRTVAEMQKIYDAMKTGVAFVMVQKSTGKEWGKGGEGMMEKARLSINLSKAFKTERGTVSSMKVVKCKKIRAGQSNPDGKQMFYLAGRSGLLPLSGWGYMNQKAHEDFTKSLMRKMGVVDHQPLDCIPGAVDAALGAHGWRNPWIKGDGGGNGLF